MNTYGYRWEQIAPFGDEDSCIIEFQAFRGNNNKYIVKELVILDVKSGVTNYFLFKPPFPFKHLNKKNARTNRWLSKHFHHITWDEGFVDYRELRNILFQYSNKYKHIFTTGLEKCNLLSSYVSSEVTVYNICRNKEENISGICIGIRCKNHKFLNCAMSNAYSLKATLQRESKYFLPRGGGKVVGMIVGHK